MHWTRLLRTSWKRSRCNKITTSRDRITLVEPIQVYHRPSRKVSPYFTSSKHLDNLVDKAPTDWASTRPNTLVAIGIRPSSAISSTLLRFQRPMPMLNATAMQEISNNNQVKGPIRSRKLESRDLRVAPMAAIQLQATRALEPRVRGSPVTAVATVLLEEAPTAAATTPITISTEEPVEATVTQVEKLSNSIKLWSSAALRVASEESMRSWTSSPHQLRQEMNTRSRCQPIYS